MAPLIGLIRDMAQPFVAHEILSSPFTEGVAIFLAYASVQLVMVARSSGVHELLLE